MAHRNHVVGQLYDERFFRMWEFYLAGCEVVFRFDRQVVFQLQLTRTLGATPLTRAYIHRTETGRPAMAAE